MRIYEVRHRCGTFLTEIDETYTGGNYPYCKKCGFNVKLTPMNIKNPQFEFKIKKDSASASASADSE